MGSASGSEAGRRVGLVWGPAESMPLLLRELEMHGCDGAVAASADFPRPGRLAFGNAAVLTVPVSKARDAARVLEKVTRVFPVFLKPPSGAEGRECPACGATPVRAWIWKTAQGFLLKLGAALTGALLDMPRVRWRCDGCGYQWEYWRGPVRETAAD